MNRLCALVMCIAIAGCARWAVRAKPVPAQCNAACYIDDNATNGSACASKAKWEGDPRQATAFDKLIYDTIPALREETWACGARLKACQQCLKRLQEAGVVELP